MANKERVDDITIRGASGAQVIFRNFAGEATAFNNPGDRNFCLVIDEELAERLEQIGFTIKRTKEREDYDSVPYIKIKVGYTLKDGSDNNYPPKIFKIDSTGMKMLDKNNVKLLDGARMNKVELEFSARPYEDRKTGEIKYTAYLKSFYAEIEESALEREYNERFANMDSQDPSRTPW